MKLINWKEVRFFIHMLFIKKEDTEAICFYGKLLAECIVFAIIREAQGKPRHASVS
jgi:hypothetical protein